VTEAKRGAARDDTPLQMDDEQVSRVSFATPEIAEQALLLVVSPALDAEGARTRGMFDGANRRAQAIAPIAEPLRGAP
jgi:hypothetical protein